MKKLNIACIASALTIISAISIAPIEVSGSSDDNGTFYFYGINCNKKNDSCDIDTIIFNKNNSKYLSKETQKSLEEIEKCMDKGNKLTKDQIKICNEALDCILKGKLGESDYKTYKNLMSKAKKGKCLTKEEEKQLKEFKKCISSSETSTKNFFENFLR